MLNLKKIAMGLFVLGQFGVISNSFSAPAQSNTQVVKRYDSLNTAAQDYAKVLQEIANYSSREMSKSINPYIDKYVSKSDNPTIKKQWDDATTMLLEPYVVSVYKVNENGKDGEVVFLIKGYDESALNKYLGENAKKYILKIDDSKDEIELDIDAYIKLEYDYLSKTPKVNLATSTVKFEKGSDNKWQVVEEK